MDRSLAESQLDTILLMTDLNVGEFTTHDYDSQV